MKAGSDSPVCASAGSQGDAPKPSSPAPVPLSEPQSLRDVATAIYQGEAYVDEDARRLALAYLRTLARDT